MRKPWKQALLRGGPLSRFEVIRETELDGVRLWSYMGIGARIGRRLFSAMTRHGIRLP